MIDGRDTIRAGHLVMSWDFEPMTGIPARFVTGRVTAVEHGLVDIDVLHDSTGMNRKHVQTPLKLFFGEWEGRLTIIDL